MGYLHHYLNQLGTLLRDGSMIEVAINGDGRIWIERAGQAFMTETQAPGLDETFPRELAKQIANDQSLRLSETTLMISNSVAFEGVNLRC